MKVSKLAQKSFNSNDGNVVLFQWPNLPLYGWILFAILHRLVAAGSLRNGFEMLSMAFLFTWAYLEITKGVNYFRKVLGVLVLLVIVLAYFK